MDQPRAPQDMPRTVALRRGVLSRMQLAPPSALMAASRNAVVALYGQCDECGCPAFAGQGTYCERTSCGHHWKSHKRE